ncbi:glycosyltransferase family A protein [Pseudoalteromonas piratica]|uniref:Glycosyltransferase 2-like domain-containing protein n=1 Tax=Pseudoalteromonas piratica TaxID=1348114 RepID=A0A0A7EDL2_9GAMM|nr:glycosyltransferase family A protein [Pseudoalteromonas piratica]AIY64598.1 hypothetical protein OM33_05120 [Pseudoalteromonas piratica]
MKISIIIPTIDLSPRQKNSIHSIIKQTKNRDDVEVLLLSGKYPLDLPCSYSNHIKAIHFKNKSVIELRAIALKLAIGKYIFFTEDHCIVNPHWVENIETFFDDNTNIGIIGGNVINGSQFTTWDRANYWMTFNNYLTTSRAKKFSPCIANLAIRESMISNQYLAAGELEALIGQLDFTAINIGNPVTHVQSHGTYKTLLIHFHNGRACVGLVRYKYKGLKLPLKIAKILMLPCWLTFQVTSNIAVSRSSNKFTFLPDTIIILMLIICHTLGELTGLLFGPGESPQNLN